MMFSSGPVWEGTSHRSNVNSHLFGQNADSPMMRLLFCEVGFEISLGLLSLAFATTMGVEISLGLLGSSLSSVPVFMFSGVRSRMHFGPDVFRVIVVWKTSLLPC